jgi:predicted nuclease of predicted toxin-antitoxin system
VRILADENIPFASLRVLRAAGNDVVAVSETMPRASDKDVLTRAETDGRLLVTFDRDFAALAFKHALPAAAGVVLLRFVPISPDEVAALLLDLVGDEGLTFSGKFTVVDRERVRQRLLPSLGAEG